MLFLLAGAAPSADSDSVLLRLTRDVSVLSSLTLSSDGGATEMLAALAESTVVSREH